MGSHTSRAWWPIVLLTLVFGFGLASVVSLALLRKSHARGRLAADAVVPNPHEDEQVWSLTEDGRPKPRKNAFGEASNPAAINESGEAPVSLDDPRLEVLRQAADSWRRSAGPRRLVIDQVCLVPDVPAFLEAIALWDERHFFPILIDEPARTLPFLRAFRPARVVRYVGGVRPRLEAPRPDDRQTPVDHEAVWHEAARAVARAWSDPTLSDADLAPGGAPPRWLSPTPPGVVLASPEGSMLAGAVALAAGRFQPLVRLEPDAWTLNDQGLPARPRHFGDTLKLSEAWHFARRVEDRIHSLFAHYDRLGDDCDFLTLAGDWPYRFNNESGRTLLRGRCALDDLIGRALPPGPKGDWLVRSRRRWAYTGRLLGDPAASVAGAMAALFLQPASALLWNTYGRGKPWSEYEMSSVVARLRPLFADSAAVVHRAGTQADLAGWHRATDPINRFGLILINSSGGPRQFAITGGPGRAGDLPSGIPAAVSMIHSFSAADPTDPQTIAGRWLDQGAFVYYGSMNEPYVDAFRTPRLIGDLIAAEVPLSAALRQGEYEAFGHPWRLVYLGDPLYRIQAPRGDNGGPGRPAGHRLDSIDWRNIAREYADWDVIEITAKSTAELLFQASLAFESEEARLAWCLDVAIGRLASKRPDDDAGPRPPFDWRSVLRQVQRDRLDRRLRPAFDDLLIDTLREAGDLLELSARLDRIPTSERSPHVWQAIESCATDRLARLIQDPEHARIFAWALDLWDEVMRQSWPEGSEFPEQFTERVTVLAAADARRRLGPWHDRLRRTGDALAAQPGRYPHARVITAERARIEARAGRRG